MTEHTLANDIAGRVLYRDHLILVIDKPAGLPVHPGPKGGLNLEDLLPDLRFDKRDAPKLAHRLDRDTSGCLALGRDAKAIKRLGKLFEAKRVGKVYWAVTQGRPPADEGTVDLPLAKRSTEARGWWMKVDRQHGKPAVTDYRVLGTSPEGHSWVELRPRTGRTHQIRVHLAELGCPVLGDPVYGAEGAVGREAIAAAREEGRPLMLHARSLSLPLYAAPPVEAVAPVPDHLRAALLACGWSGEEPIASAPTTPSDRAAEPAG